jgi:hypothetical protein
VKGATSTSSAFVVKCVVTEFEPDESQYENDGGDSRCQPENIDGGIGFVLF